MEIISSREQFVRHVLGTGLWHTTSEERYERICADGAIKVEPDVPDACRHKTANGPSNFPYVRHLGGVSLFDFSGFCPDQYSRDCPLSSWQYFVPIAGSQKKAIWIELDRDILAPAPIGPVSLLERWKREAAYAHVIMPRIEAAYIGDIPASAFRRVLAVEECEDEGWAVVGQPPG